MSYMWNFICMKCKNKFDKANDIQGFNSCPKCNSLDIFKPFDFNLKERK